MIQYTRHKRLSRKIGMNTKMIDIITKITDEEDTTVEEETIIEDIDHLDMENHDAFYATVSTI